METTKYMETTKRLVSYAAVALMLTAASVSAQAQSFDSKDISVRVYDLDLSKPDDAQTLLQRISKAARVACTRSGDSRDFQIVRERGACERESYTSTLAVINTRTGIDLEAIAARSTRVPDVASSK